MTQSFASLGLAAELTRAVADEGYTTPTPVQVQAIPVILEGRDVLAGAQTGTGKTAGFTLPLLQRLAGRANASTSPARHPVRALILTPTRELAAQVEESVRTYGRHLSLKSALVFGGVNINPQIEALRRGVDILVATPGRLLDHLGQKTVNLSQVEILVLDEADRMLDMGFIRDIRKILALLPAQRQNLLFSATFSDEIRKLADGLLHNPALVEVARRNAESDLVAQRIHPVDQSRKRELLSHLVSGGDWRQVLVFTRTKHGANRLAEQLCKDGIEATAIHGNKSQPARTKALAGFKAGTVRVLVATDIAARGLDIEELPHVINYEMPNVPEDYVHRIGRTGRAGSTGEAISLVSPEERSFLADIEKLLKRRIEQQVISGFAPGTASPVKTGDERARQPAARRGEHRRGAGEASRRDTGNAGRRSPGEGKRRTEGNAGHRASGDASRRADGGAGRRGPGSGQVARTPTAPHARLAERPPRGDDEQPLSNATAAFPSSSRVYPDPDPYQPLPRSTGRRGSRGPAPALLGGPRRRAD